MKQFAPIVSQWSIAGVPAGGRVSIGQGGPERGTPPAGPGLHRCRFLALQSPRTNAFGTKQTNWTSEANRSTPGLSSRNDYCQTTTGFPATRHFHNRMQASAGTRNTRSVPCGRLPSAQGKPPCVIRAVESRSGQTMSCRKASCAFDTPIAELSGLSAVPSSIQRGGSQK